ncbi:hypothetical protein SAMN02746098_05262 [Desulfosporosinus lacus DSM 15449]|uniref:Uncharacterized protein n=1 Tax=Desulfosporosinus lacus DSM 15449 TaxID=1121420 RepID=A0A1M6H170_9FIRM|nr:hypothetical protein SAMN02746098_05262 [Desulfosporosinus lacus DSM 15449]
MEVNFQGELLQVINISANKRTLLCLTGLRFEVLNFKCLTGIIKKIGTIVDEKKLE